MTDEMMAPRSPGTSVEPSAPSVEDADRAVQEPGPAPQAVGHEPDAGERVRGGDAGGHSAPRTREEALEALDYITPFCADCTERSRCREDACAIFQAERAALRVLNGEPVPVKAGVPLEWSLV